MKIKVGKRKLPEERYVQALAKRSAAVGKHKTLVVIGVLLLLAAGAGVLLFLQHRKNATERAWEAVADIQLAEEVESTALITAGTDAEPLFIIRAGKLLFESKKKEDLDRAEDLYRGFLERWAHHPGAPYVKQSLAYVLEEKDKYREALDVFSFLADGDGPLAVESMWDAGRCAEKIGDLDLAKDFYRQSAKHEDVQPWSSYAGVRLAELISAEKTTNEEGKNNG